MKLKKTAILGGTFNPIHFAHLAMAEAVLEQAGPDEVWFMPSRKPPHKSHREIVPEEHRTQMIRLAIAQEPAFCFSGFELERRGTTYTAETLQLLQGRYPDREFSFIMGGDSFFQLEDWYRPDVIMKTCGILAISRNGVSGQQMRQHAAYLQREYKARVRILQMESMDISSSKIRRRVREGRDISGLVPESVAGYIDQHMLYR